LSGRGNGFRKRDSFKTNGRELLNSIFSFPYHIKGIGFDAFFVNTILTQFNKME